MITTNKNKNLKKIINNLKIYLNIKQNNEVYMYRCRLAVRLEKI